MKRLIITEENFIRTMEEKVEPELEEKRETVWLERQSGKKLYSVIYRADRAEGIILISHGFTETSDKYQEVIYYFLQMGLSVMCMEHCGHGRSYRLTEDLSLVHADHYKRYVSDLIYAADYLKKLFPGQKLFVFGHSMGGGIAAAAASKRPELFSGVILSSPMIQPETRPVPWVLAECTAGFCVMTGRGGRYVAGQKPYRNGERFEDSASASYARFEYYQRKRKADPLFQMSAPSYGWLFTAAQLKHFLMRTGWKNLRMPVTVFEADQEKFVSNSSLERFVKKVKRRGNISLIKMSGSRHEIYNSDEAVLGKYYGKMEMEIKRILAET